MDSTRSSLLPKAAVMAAALVVSTTCLAASPTARVLWHKTVASNLQISASAFSASGERLAVVAVPPGFPQQRGPEIMVFAVSGRLIWRRSLPTNEYIGRIGIAPNGQRLFCDYWTYSRALVPADGGLHHDWTKDPCWPSTPPLGGLAPAEVARGGVYCFGPSGKVLWKTSWKAAGERRSGSSLPGCVAGVTGDRLLLLKPGTQDVSALAVLNFSGQVVFRRQFSQSEPTGAALFPDGRSLAVTWQDHVRLLDMSGRTVASLEGVGCGNPFFPGASAMSPDGRLLLYSSGRLLLVDRDGRAKWRYVYPKSWPPEAKRGGETWVTDYPPVLGSGKHGVSVLVLRGAQRVVFRLSPTCDEPRKISLPALTAHVDETLLSPDGTMVAILGQAPWPDAGTETPWRVTLYSSSGARLSTASLRLTPFETGGTLYTGGEFSNPARYFAASAGRDLYLIQTAR